MEAMDKSGAYGLYAPEIVLNPYYSCWIVEPESFS